jgi:putative ABC transport system ATP-binding protein
MSRIEIRDLTKGYRVKGTLVPVLTNVSISFDAGQMHALVGPSGCGKSTFLMLCGGLIHPDAGTVQLDGKELLALRAGGRARAQAELVGFVYQQFHLIPYLNIEQNIMASCLARPVPDAKQRCQELIERLGLEHRRGHIPGKLSSGEQQRVALARALMNRPKVLIADEPTGNLDSENADHLLSLLREFSDAGGLVLMATHDSAVAERADCIYNVNHGAVSLYPSTDTNQKNSTTRNA